MSSLPPLTYHIDRRLNTASGFWKTVTTFGSRRAGIVSMTAHFAPELLELGRTEDEGDGTPLRIYNRAGELIKSSQPKPEVPTPKLRQSSPFGAALARAAVLQAAAVHRPVPVPFDRTWVENFVLAPDGVLARQARLRQRYGVPSRTDRGTDVYTVAHDSNFTTLEVDPVTAGPLGIVVAMGSVVVSRTTISYARAADGTLTRAHIRTESSQPGVSGGNRVTEMDITNIQLGKEG